MQAIRLSLLMLIVVATTCRPAIGGAPPQAAPGARAGAPPISTAAPVPRGLFDTEGFTARWLSGRAWTGPLGWTHILADVFIWLAYMTIPVIIGLYMLRRRDVPFPGVGWLFVAFIFLCGTGHLIDAVMFWWPGYRLLAVVKVLTALVSIATVAALVPVLPKALALPGIARMNTQLAAEVDARRRAEGDLKRTIQVWSEANRELAFQKFALDQAGIVAITDASGRLTYVNHKFCQVSRHTREELLGQDHRIVGSGYHPKTYFEEMYGTIRRGDVWHGEFCNRAKDGCIYWVDSTIVPFRNVEGKVTRYIAVCSEITERKRAEAQLERALAWKESALQRERTLLRELEHRVRNNLAGLLGLTSIYERSGKAVSEVASALRGKIRAMLQVHELMSPDPGAPIPLGTLVRKLAEQCVSPDRLAAVTLSGSRIELRPKHAGAIAMIVQELFTNSAKYGALSQEDGSMAISWALEDAGGEQRLELKWEERSGLPPAPCNTEGVGLRLIRGLSESELRGSVAFSFERDGFVCRLRARLGGESVPVGGPAINPEHSDEPADTVQQARHQPEIVARDGPRSPAGAGR